MAKLYSDEFDTIVLHEMYRLAGVLFPTGGARLHGAFSLRISLGGSAFFNEYYRVTKDLDFEVRDLSKLVNIERYKSALSAALFSKGIVLSKFNLIPREGSQSIKLKAENSEYQTRVLKIDMSINGDTFPDGLMSAEEVFARKLSLGSYIIDRRPKDKMDVFAIITLLLNGNVTKGKLLSYLSKFNQKLNRSNLWHSNENFQKSLDSIRSFSPKEPVRGYTSDKIMLITRHLYMGLYDERLSKDAVFSIKDGWRQ